MALIVATEQSDIPGLVRVLSELGLTSAGASMAVPAAAPVQEALPVASEPTVAQVNERLDTIDGTTFTVPGHMSGWRSIYAQVAERVGRSLVKSEKATVRETLKAQGSLTLRDAAALVMQTPIGRPVVDRPSPSPAQSERMARLEALRAEEAALLAEESAPSTPTVAARTRQLDMVPPFAHLTPAQQEAMQTWRDKWVHKARIEAFDRYTSGAGTWADVVNTGVESKKALAKLNKA